MSGHERDLRDLSIVQAISGSEDIEHPGIQIVEDYFLREAEENRREAGFSVQLSEENAPRSEKEIKIWLHNKWLSELELARTKRVMEWENPEMEPEEFVSAYLPKEQHIITI